MMNFKADNTQPASLFVACGMYAFTDELRNAWQLLFEHFFNLTNTTFEIDRILRFDTGQEVLKNPSLWFGHTCGYPLMTSLRDLFTPICVPVFDLAGCDQIYYSSQIIVAENSSINTLQDCKGLRAVINSNDSNSGMNVLRHAVAAYNNQGNFFNRVELSGSHLQSLTEVASQNADIAAIDCVSYGLIQDSFPELASRVRSIGFSVKTCGLPFVLPTSIASNNDLSGITENLNHALSMLDDKQRNRLHLRGFEKVDINQYQRILDLENSAQQSGYPILA